MLTTNAKSLQLTMINMGRCGSRVWYVVVAAMLLSGAPARAQVGGLGTAPERATRASIQPGDRMVVKVYRELELSDTVMVTADGKIVLARIGTVDATSLTIAALADTLRGRYARFLRNPAVDLVILRRVAVNGEVAKPNVYYVDIATTLRDVIARAGGITEVGDASHVEIIRRGERIRVPNWQDDFTLASDLNSGDEIVVGMRPWLSRNAFSAVSAFSLVVSLFVTLRR